ncbi:glycosyltransferase family A protein [Microbulbifer sp. JTAC008]|uniref:glycosyltransferase family A protein n=1 Tax=unclassified Microbulbifer TaxID=2619833 RepID=UPI0040394C22
MFKGFTAKRSKKNTINNNLKLDALVWKRILEQSTLSGNDSGVGNAAKHSIVVSLTSYGKRIHDIHLCIESLFQQSLKADLIVLWLSTKEFPDYMLPNILMRQVDRGLRVEFVDEDLGPYTKYYYALQKFPDSLIVTVDDDILYPMDTIDMLYQSYLKFPSHIFCHRAHRIGVDKKGNILPYNKWRTTRETWKCNMNIKPSYRVFPTGVGGVLYYPGSLHPDVLNKDKFLELCPSADDIWLKAMSMRQGVRCARVPDVRFWRDRFLTIPGCQASGLKKQNLKGKCGNDKKIHRVFSEYNLSQLLLE